MQDNTQSLLSQLKGLHTLDGVSMFPLAIGWYFVIALVVILVIVAMIASIFL